MRTIKIDIINKKALKLLREMELLKLIRVRKEESKSLEDIDWLSYKGKMSKQSISDIDKQLNDLRNEWD